MVGDDVVGAGLHPLCGRCRRRSECSVAGLDLPLGVLDQWALPASQALPRATPLPLVMASMGVDGPVVCGVRARGGRQLRGR